MFLVFERLVQPLTTVARATPTSLSTTWKMDNVYYNAFSERTPNPTITTNWFWRFRYVCSTTLKCRYMCSKNNVMSNFPFSVFGTILVSPLTTALPHNGKMENVDITAFSKNTHRKHEHIQFILVTPIRVRTTLSCPRVCSENDVISNFQFSICWNTVVERY